MPFDLSTIQSFLGIVLSVVAIIGIPVGIYKIYAKDQEKDGEKTNNLASRLELLETKLTGEIKNLATALGGEMKNLTTEFTAIKLNHLHTIEEKQKDQDAQIGNLTIATEKLTTIIDERVPRKTVENVV